VAVLSRDFEGGGISRNGIIMAVVGLVVVLSLFFIPEIIEFQKSFSSGNNSRDSKKTQVAQKAELDNTDTTASVKNIEADDSSGMIDRISTLLDGGKGKTDARASLAKTSLSAETKGKKRSSTQPPSELTWDRIRAAESRNALTKAKSTATTLMDRLDDRAPGSQHALLNFSNGIDFVLEGSSQKMSAKEAANYLGSLNLAVSRALVREGVERKVVMQWSKVSLGPVLNVEIGAEQAPAQQFNPQMTVSWLRLRQRPKEGRPDPRARLKAYVGGYVIGDDVESVEVLTAEGGVGRPLNLTRSLKHPGYQFFRFLNVGERPTILRARSQNGIVFEKVYDFASGTQRFPYEHRAYRLPFSTSFASPRRFVVQDVDLRLDQFFTRGVWQGTEAQLVARSRGTSVASAFESSAEGPLFSTF